MPTDARAIRMGLVGAGFVGVHHVERSRSHSRKRAWSCQLLMAVDLPQLDLPNAVRRLGFVDAVLDSHRRGGVWVDVSAPEPTRSLR